MKPTTYEEGRKLGDINYISDSTITQQRIRHYSIENPHSLNST
jgi:hypothetical protein